MEYILVAQEYTRVAQGSILETQEYVLVTQQGGYCFVVTQWVVGLGLGKNVRRQRGGVMMMHGGDA